MEFGSLIEKPEIVARFLQAKFQERDFKELMLNISYSVEIHLCKDPEPSIDAIERVVLQRIWLSGSKTPGDYKPWCRRKHPDEDAFSPKVFSFADDKANGLALLALLALKAAFDHVRDFEREGLLFLSETTALREHGVWSGRRDCELDQLATRIRRSALKKEDIKRSLGDKKHESVMLRIENDAVKKTDTKIETKVKPKPPAIPLVDEFLLYPDEMYNMVCWAGSNPSLDTQQLIAEKAWVLNTYPELVKIYTHDRSELRGRALLKVLNAFFPKGTLRTSKQIEQYEAIAQNHEIPSFQAVSLADPETERLQRSQEMRSILEKLKQHEQEKSPEIVDFGYVFARRPSSEFVGRVAIKNRLDDFVQNAKPNARYLLIVGDPGIGKTAVISNYLADRSDQFVHYFIQWRKEELDSPTKFLSHLYYALSHKYDLKTQQVPSDPGVIIEILKRRIKEISETRMSPGKREIIFVDGLDEATATTVGGSTISDLLTFDLPENFGIVISTRMIPEVNKFAESGNKNVIYLRCKDEANKSDLAEYLTSKLNKKIESPSWIAKFVARSEGSFVYATMLVDMIIKGEMTLNEIYLSTPPGLDGIYKQRLKIIEERTKDPRRVDQIRSVVRMVAIVRAPHSPEEICDYLCIDRFDIDSVFGAVGQFLDSDAYVRTRKCIWFHTTFGDFILTSGLFPEKEQRRYHQIIVDYSRTLFEKGKYDEYSGYLNQHFIWHCYPFSDIDTILRLVRSELLTDLCRMPIFPLSWVTLIDLAARAALRRNPGEILFFLLFFYVLLPTPLHDEPRSKSKLPVTKQLEVFQEQLEMIKDPTSLLEFTTKALTEKTVGLEDFTYVAKRLSAFLRNRFVTVAAAYEACTEMYQSFPAELKKRWTD